jgi:hypothetical protein
VIIMDSIEDRTNNVNVLASRNKKYDKFIILNNIASGNVSSDRIKTCNTLSYEFKDLSEQESCALRLRNSTDFPDMKIREIIEFVRPKDLPTLSFYVKVKYSDAKVRGMLGLNSECFKNPAAIGTKYIPSILCCVYRSGSIYPFRTDNRPRKVVGLDYDEYNVKIKDWVTISVIQPVGTKHGSTGGYIDRLVLSAEEEIIHNFAHELRHLWQFNHHEKRGKAWGARGRFSERDADAYAMRKTREWRRKNTMTVGLVDWEAMLLNDR